MFPPDRQTLPVNVLEKTSPAPVFSLGFPGADPVTSFTKDRPPGALPPPPHSAAPLARLPALRELRLPTHPREQSLSDAQPITGLRPGEVPPYLFLCGDPGRVDRIASRWSQPREVCAVREFRVVTGAWRGVALGAASTGVGAPGTAVLVEELAKLGCHTLLRIGNSGGLAPELELGDLVITTAAVRDDGTSRSYVTPEYPAAADWRAVAALAQAAEQSGARWHAGVTWSLDAFYVRNAVAGPGGTLESMSYGGYWTPQLEHKIRAMQAARVLNCEMEAGVLLTLAGLFGLRAGCICVVSDRTPWPGPSALDLDRNMDRCIDVAHEALHHLATATPKPGCGGGGTSPKAAAEPGRDGDPTTRGGGAP